MPIRIPEKTNRNDPRGVLLPYYEADTQLRDDPLVRASENSVNRFLVHLYCVGFVLTLLAIMVRSWA